MLNTANYGCREVIGGKYTLSLSVLLLLEDDVVMLLTIEDRGKLPTNGEWRKEAKMLGIV